MRPSNSLENKILSDTMKSSASIWRSPDSQFFRTTTGIQWRPDAFDKSRLVMTFWTNFGVTGILCTFRLVLEGKKHFPFWIQKIKCFVLERMMEHYKQIKVMILIFGKHLDPKWVVLPQVGHRKLTCFFLGICSKNFSELLQDDWIL